MLQTPGILFHQRSHGVCWAGTWGGSPGIHTLRGSRVWAGGSWTKTLNLCGASPVRVRTSQDWTAERRPGSRSPGKRSLVLVCHPESPNTRGRKRKLATLGPIKVSRVLKCSVSSLVSRPHCCLSSATLALDLDVSTFYSRFFGLSVPHRA